MGERKGFNLAAVSRSRPHLLGLATIWVALFHSYRLNFLASSGLTRLHLAGILNRLKDLGNCGVDVFLFLSGLGLYYSLSSLREKDTPHPIRAFYARRFSRVLPPVLIVSILHYGLARIGSVQEWVGKVFLIGSFLPVQIEPGYWYFALLMVLYLLYPLIDLIYRKGRMAGMIGLILLSLLLAFAVSRRFPAWFGKLEIMLTRIPVFLLGVMFAPWCRKQARIPGWIPWLCALIFAAGIFLIPLIPERLSAMRRYAYAPMTVALVLSDSLICGWLKGKGFLYKVICLIGTYSMEIYLLYENLYVMDPPLFRSVDPAGIIYALTVFTASLVLSALLKAVVAKLREGMEKTP